MSNPTLASHPVFNSTTTQPYYQPGQAVGVTSATGRMTYDDVIVKTGGLFLIILAAGAAAWALVDEAPYLWVVGLIGGLVLGLVNSFKKEPAPALIMAYAGFEGLLLGGLSVRYEALWDGVVVQAVLATLGVFAATLILFRSGRVRVTPKFTRFLLIALVGYGLFALSNFVLVATGVLDGWGMRNGGFGMIIGIVAVVLAAMSLIADFDSIERGVRNGVDRKYAWAGAFGLTVTLVWLYLELLRLIAIFRD